MDAIVLLADRIPLSAPVVTALVASGARKRMPIEPHKDDTCYIRRAAKAEAPKGRVAKRTGSK